MCMKWNTPPNGSQRLEKSIDDAIAKRSCRKCAPSLRPLQALRGVAKITAVSIVAEVARCRRFKSPGN